VRIAYLLSLALIAGCQSQAHRLLLVDLTLADPVTLDATVAPWHAAGYRVEYRRFYPHLTRADLGRYRTLILLGGREPGARSDALTTGDLAILAEWIRRDGVVVFGYTDGELDRWVMNRWLAAQGAGIAIGEDPRAVQISATPLPHSALDNAGFAPFPAGRNRPLVLHDRSQTLARAPNAAVVAASRARDGLIVIASRSLLASADTSAATRAFLVALARWTRRPAEWASVGAATHASSLQLPNAPQPVAVRPPSLAPPVGAEAIALPEPPNPNRAGDNVSVPGWVTRQGMRVLWSRFTLWSLDSLLRFVDVAALNALATTIPQAALTDTTSTRNLWKITGERLQATSIRWFPAAVLSAISSDGADEVDRHGALTRIPCGLDSLYWRNGLRPTYRVLARLGAGVIKPDVITGVGLDLDSAMALFRGSGFCDADYQIGLAALGLERAEIERLAALPPAVRYDTLLERGWLSRYFQGLEDAVAGRASVLRGELRRLRPDVRFAFHTSDAPTDWFSLGLLRGFSSPDAPIFLWLREDTRPTLARRYRVRDVFALSAIGLEPVRATFAPAELSRLRFAAFTEHAGFWLDGAATDSLGRVIRRFAK